MKNGIVKLNGKLFRFDRTNSMVEYVARADKQMLLDNEEWQKEFGKNLWDIDGDGFVTIMSVGLSAENWDSKENREAYLSMWCDDIDEEMRFEAKMFLKYG